MKSLFLGVLLIIIVGIGGFVYRNAVEHPNQPIVCPMDAKVCPDGTSVARTGSTCTFAACPLPNVMVDSLGISFAIPDGFRDVSTAEDIAYEMPANASTSQSASIIVQSFPIEASSTALATIQKTAIGDGSGLPVPVTSYTSGVFGTHRFTIVQVGRFEGVVTTAYYLARGTAVLRFDAIDRGVDWTNPKLDVAALPAHVAIQKLLATLQAE